MSARVWFYWFVSAMCAGAAPTSKGLYYLDRQTGDPRLILAAKDAEIFTSPQVSPDGKLVLFDNATAPGDSDTQPNFTEDHVCVTPIEGGKMQDLGRGLQPSWSPDGKQICFSLATNVGEEQPGIYIMSSDGKGRQYLTTGWACRLSPDGSKLAYFDNHSIHLLDMEDLSHKYLSAPHADCTGAPGWSPDGKSIAFVLYGSGPRDRSLALLDVNQENQTPHVIWSSLPLGRSPSWSPNEKILIMAATPEGTNLCVVDSTHEESFERLLPSKLSFTIKDPCWTPDGKGVVFVKPK